MLTINALAEKNGTIAMTEHQDYLKRKYVGERAGRRIRLTIEEVTPESRNLRKFYHGAIIPLWAYLDDKDYRDSTVLLKLHEVAKEEFNPEWVNVSGKMYKVGKTSKGKELQPFVEKIIDFLVEQYGIDPLEVLNPDVYKDWASRIYPFGGPDTFIGYLISIGKI